MKTKKLNAGQLSMYGSKMSVEIALLLELKLANRAREFWLDADALVLLVSPEGREHRVNAIAVRADVLLFFLSPFVHRALLVISLGHYRRRIFAALKEPVTGQRRHQRELPAAIVAEVLPRAPTVHLHLFMLHRHGAEMPGVS